jgi:hypothetical protein
MIKANSSSNLDFVNLRDTRPRDSTRPKTSSSSNDISTTINNAISTNPVVSFSSTHNIRDSIPIATKPKKQRRANPEKRRAEKEAELYKSHYHMDVSTDLLFSNISDDSQRRLHAMIKNFFILKDGSLSTHINLHQYAIDSGAIVSNVVLQEVCNVQPNVISLDLTDCHDITDAGLWSLARQCQRLESLILSGCNQITIVGLRSLALSCTSITSLDLTHCTLLDDMGLSVLAAGGWRIKSMVLKKCTGNNFVDD